MRDMVKVRRPTDNRFTQEPSARIGRSQFNRSHGVKKTFDASGLYPIFVDEVLPGDTMTCRLNGFCRLFSPLDAPIMDNIELETFFFYVPNRIMWDHWVDFMGEHRDGAGPQDTDYTIPRIADGLVIAHGSGVTASQLLSHMGVPHGLATTDVHVNALPFRAYNKIYNEWFRDQNLIVPETEHVDDGPDASGDYGIWMSAKKHDYFTSCLPYLQKGDAVGIALTGFPEVETSQAAGNDVAVWATAVPGYRELDSDGATVDVSANVASAAQCMYVDLSSVVGMDVNVLRQSMAIQRLLEKDARGGTRYVELIKAHFGVTSPDYRLQRPEYLGGGKSFINVSPVANTSDINAATAAGGADVFQGELRGVATGVIQGHGWAKSFTEHGYIIGIVRARSDITYFQGLDRLFTRQTRYDFYIPELANLGEQSVLNKEIWISNAAADNNVFGYQERWAEYRFKKSEIHGKMNPDAAGALSHWHLAEDFAALPTLGVTFIEDQTPMARVTTIDTEPEFLLDIWFDYKCARPMPVRSVPSLLGGRF